MVAGPKAHITGAGSCTITASQAGNGNYNPASSVDRTFAIAKADQTITFRGHRAEDLWRCRLQPAASASSGLSVSFSAAGDCNVALVPRSQMTVARQLHLTASQAGNANYNPATNVDRTLAIAKADQTITFAAIAAKTYGDADFNLTASASSGLSVSFSATGDCTVVAGPKAHITGAGSCTITASQAGNANYNAAPGVDRIVTINKAGTSVTVASSANPSMLGGSVTFAATVSSTAGTPGGTVQFRIDGTDVGTPVALDAAGKASYTTSTLAVNNHTVTAVYGGAANYAASTNSLAGGQNVRYRWTGFFQPIDNDPDQTGSAPTANTVWNVAKSGSTIPVKFSLAGNQGLSIIFGGAPTAPAVTCPNSTASLDPIEETTTTSGLKYDATADQYNYAWKTATNYSGTCRRLELKLVDGTSHYAFFKFTK